MSSIDLVELLKEELIRGQRPPDGLLHASGDLVGPLRHSQLKLAGAPYKETPLAQQIRLETGTMWHRRMHDIIVASGVPFMQEVKLNQWLPEGWGGTADWVILDDWTGNWHLKDLKTIKPEGLRWVMDGPKEEHIWQLSAYWYALDNAGLTLEPVIEVMYLPMGDTNDDTLIEPVMVQGELLEEDLIRGVMEDRWAATRTYLEWFHNGEPNPAMSSYGDHNRWLNPMLAPPMEREQKVTWNNKQGVWDVKLVPHWSAMFCPFDTELCACSEAGVTKIGHYTLEGVYEPRTGYDLVQPYERPSDTEVRKRRASSTVPTL